MLNDIKKSMREYYRSITARNWHFPDQESDRHFYDIRGNIFRNMDEYYAEHPDTHPALLKSRTHTLIAESCDTVIFENNPFYYEIGMREGNSWGLSGMAPSHWIREVKRKEMLRDHPIVEEIERYIFPLYSRDELNMCRIPSAFDTDHHTLGYRKLFKCGLKGIIEDTQASMKKFPNDSEQYLYCSAILESCDALLRIAKKFGDAAKRKLATETNKCNIECLKLIAETAERIPLEPPQTFFEGLEMLLFTREVIATLENIGISSFGQVDLLLGELYEKDIQNKTLTEEHARELVDIWMIHTDIKFHLEESSWPETSTCIQLGGCNEKGEPVFNDVTRIFIEEHHKIKAVNPKLNCRYNQNSPDEYLHLIGKAVLAGHNNFVLINDDVIIGGLIKNGVELEDARGYVNGGCQETMIEGCGHTEGAATYISLIHIFDLFLRKKENADFITPISSANSFEEFYAKFTYAAKRFINVIFEQRNIRQYYNKQSLHCPLFSATQKGCIETGTDYTHGGAKYNFSTVALLGIASLTDSLYAVKKLVYDKKVLTLNELIDVLDKNWNGNDELLKKAIDLHKYGHGYKDVDELANRLISEFSDYVNSIRNERGGKYLPSLFVYYHYRNLSSSLRATPDGRKDFDLMSPGCSPSQLKPIRDAIVPIRTMQNIDFTACRGGNSVLDMIFPASKQIDEKIFASFIRACGISGCPTIQPNVLSVDEMRDAKINPQDHRDLIVRISGLSAYFVALTPDVQDEIISRNTYNV